VYEDSGDLTQALSHYGDALALAVQMDPGPKLVSAQTHLGLLRLRLGESSDASTLITDALALAQSIPDTLEFTAALLAVGELSMFEGNLGGAIETVEQALRREMPLESEVAARALAGRVYAALGDPDRGNSHVVQARSAAEKIGTPLLATIVSLAAGWVAAAQGDAREALSNFEVAVGKAALAQAPYQLALALEACAMQLACLGDVASAGALRARVAHLHGQLGIAGGRTTPGRLATMPS
jgi:tetratricopeptide (TPR) repeat protein